MVHIIWSEFTISYGPYDLRHIFTWYDICIQHFKCGFQTYIQLKIYIESTEYNIPNIFGMLVPDADRQHILYGSCLYLSVVSMVLTYCMLYTPIRPVSYELYHIAFMIQARSYDKEYYICCIKCTISNTGNQYQSPISTQSIKI